MAGNYEYEFLLAAGIGPADADKICEAARATYNYPSDPPVLVYTTSRQYGSAGVDFYKLENTGPSLPATILREFIRNYGRKHKL